MTFETLQLLSTTFWSVFVVIVGLGSIWADRAKDDAY